MLPKENDSFESNNFVGHEDSNESSSESDLEEQGNNIKTFFEAKWKITTVATSKPASYKQSIASKMEELEFAEKMGGILRGKTKKTPAEEADLEEDPSERKDNARKNTRKM